MKETNFIKEGKFSRRQSINKLKRENLNSESEVTLNSQFIVPLFAIGLGLLLFLANKVSTNAARQPILIEERRIIYRKPKQ